MENIHLILAKTLGEPLDSELQVPAFLDGICDLELANYGDDQYTFQTYDDSNSIVYTAGIDGEVVSARKTLAGATVLPLVGIQSKLHYISLESLQYITSSVVNKDLTAMARLKKSITRSMDNYEAKLVLDLINNLSGQAVNLATADDVYSGIMAMYHKVMDFGNNFVLLCGSTVYEAINTYDRDHVQSFNFRLGIREMCKDLGIEIIKVVGNAGLDTTTSILPVLAATKAILVAKDSTISNSKPIMFVRRKVSPEVAKAMGLNVEGQRIITSVGGLQCIGTGNVLGYGVVGYESFGCAVVNAKAIAICDELALPA